MDQIKGVVEGITRAGVEFNLDGNVVEAPVAKIEGIVFGGGTAASGKPMVLVRDVYGSQWSVSSVSLRESGDVLILGLAGGIEHQLPLDQLESLRWRSGLVMLASVEPVSAQYTPYLDDASAGTSDFLNAWFAPSAIDETDLRMHATSFVEYRVEPGFLTLSGAVAIESPGEVGGQLTVRIAVDGKQVWQQELSGAESKGFELTVNNARRVRVSVEPGDDGDVGDTVRVSALRLTK